MKPIDYTGVKQHKLEVLRLDEGKKPRRWWCKCSCGSVKSILQASISKGQQSCGCETSIRMTTHGLRHTSTYKSWASMVQRCTNPNDKAYKHYGGRGIMLEPAWLVFENFYADMGLKPNDALTIERLEVDGPYSKENCVWATILEQANNKRNTIRLENGMALPEAASSTGIPYNTIYDRICVQKMTDIDKILKK